MDKNKITAFLLILLIFVGYAWFQSNQNQKIVAEREAQNEIARVEAEKIAKEAAKLTPEDIIKNDSIAKATAEARAIGAYGEMLYSAQSKQKEEYTLQNEKVKIGISTLGATINSVELKDYKTWNGSPLYLFSEKSALFDIKYRTTVDINTSNFVFTPTTSKKDITVTGESSSLAFRLYSDSTAYVEYVYTLKADAYDVDLKVNFVNMNYLLDRNQKNLSINWAMDALQTEKGYSYENQNTNLSYKLTADNGIDELSIGRNAYSESVNEPVQWVAFKKQFFSSIIRYNDSFSAAELSYQTLPENSGELKHFDATLSVPFSVDKTSYDFSLYFAPNSYSLFRSYGDKFEKLIPLGWGIFGWINRFIVIPTFNFLSAHIANFGWIILLLTIIIKLLIFPFTYKSYVSMAKMRLIKPEVDELNTKYPNKDQAMQKQQAMMEIYRRAGVNPLGGCLPMMFQMPVLIAMFRFFPASIELRGEHFLWANDLSSYDSILNLPFNIPFYGDHVSLFALLMGASMFFSSKINMAQTSGSQQQMPGMQFMTLYIMPVMLIVWFNNYSSGLSYYYLLSNLITIGQSLIIRRFVDEDKLHDKMKNNAKKPRKKSRWQQQYEEMLQQQGKR
ncbi:MAG: membrane protein insertase YidC [Rikenellaceae bacterium]